MDAGRLIRDYLTYSDTPAAERAAFEAWAKGVSVRMIRLVAVGVGLVALLFWPVDLIIFAGRDDVIRAFSLWRVGLVALALATLVLVWLSDWCRRHPAPIVTFMATAASGVVAVAIALVYGMDAPWYHASWVMPFITLVFLFDLWTRILANLLLVCCWVLSFYFVSSGPLGFQDFLGVMVFHFFTVLGSTIFGHVIYHLSRSNFFQQRQLAERAGELEELDRLKNEFFANISHELRTPLTLILGAFRRLEGQLDDPDQAEMVTSGLRNTARLLVMINELLELARFDSGRAEPNKQVTDVAALIRHVAGSFDSSSINRIIDLVGVEKPALAEVDPRQMKTLLYNLLSNGVKFTHPGDGRIEVSLRPARDQLTVRVTDNGVGIPTGKLGSIFDRFTQVDGGERRRQAGTGIGLALVREIAEFHGGSIHAASQPGAGTAFILRLPVGQVEGREAIPFAADEGPDEGREGDLEDFLRVAARVAEDDLSALSTQDWSRAVEEGSSGTPDGQALVLVVEDNQDLRAYIKGLVGTRYRVAAARDGADGLEQARHLKPDLILTDAMMPGLSGRDMLRAIRQDEALERTPVVFLTAQSGVQARVDALRAGANDFLSKPFSEEELFARVDNLLRFRAQEQSLERMNRELADLNTLLRTRLAEQMGELVRTGELRRFLPTSVAERILGGDMESATHFERRKITVVFCDLVGYTEMTSHQEPEEMAQVLNEYLAEMTGLVVEHGGLVDKFIGDAVMAIFGPPDLEGAAQAQAALRCAERMQARVRVLARKWLDRGFAVELKTRIGLHTGFATVGVFGSDLMRSYTAVGTPVNLAARLQAVADPGQIVCSNSTWAPVKDQIRAEDRGPVELKGILQPVQAYTFLGFSAAAGGGADPQ